VGDQPAPLALWTAHCSIALLHQPLALACPGHWWPHRDQQLRVAPGLPAPRADALALAANSACSPRSPTTWSEALRQSGDEARPPGPAPPRPAHLPAWPQPQPKAMFSGQRRHVNKKRCVLAHHPQPCCSWQGAAWARFLPSSIKDPPAGGAVEPSEADQRSSSLPAPLVPTKCQRVGPWAR